MTVTLGKESPSEGLIGLIRKASHLLNKEGFLAVQDGLAAPESYEEDSENNFENNEFLNYEVGDAWRLEVDSLEAEYLEARHAEEGELLKDNLIGDLSEENLDGDLSEQDLEEDLNEHDFNEEDLNGEDLNGKDLNQDLIKVELSRRKRETSPLRPRTFNFAGNVIYSIRLAISNIVKPVLNFFNDISNSLIIFSGNFTVAPSTNFFVRIWAFLVNSVVGVFGQVVTAFNLVINELLAPFIVHDEILTGEYV